MPYEPPTHPIEGQTLVFDSDRQRQVMWLDGVLPLPPGSKVELHQQAPLAHGDAIVQQVRLLTAAGNVGAQVCLDCTVEQRWWDAVAPNEDTALPPPPSPLPAGPASDPLPDIF